MSRYLTLQEDKLLPSETWGPEVEGLTFVYAKAGAGRFASGDVRMRLSTGDLLVLGRGHSYEIGALNGGGLSLSSFSISLEHLFPVFTARDIAFLPDVLSRFGRGKIYRSGEAVTMECWRLIDGLLAQPDLVRRGQLVRVAITILAEELKAAHRAHLARYGVEERFSRAFEELSNDSIISLSVQQLAGKFGCGRRHLNRLFHRFFGLSVGKMKMELRLLKALSLLRNTDAKVIDVAHLSGFNHLGLFNTCFKRRFRRTPTQWRKLNEESESEANPDTSFPDDALQQKKSGSVAIQELGQEIGLQPFPEGSPLSRLAGHNTVPQRLVRTG